MINNEAIAVVDYGMGNTQSVANAVNYLGHDCFLTNDPDSISRADALILPGVGSFNKASKFLKESGIFEAIRENVIGRGRKILGICLGFQLLTNSSTEDGLSDGLGFIDGDIKEFSEMSSDQIKIPHVGFNNVKLPSSNNLFMNLEPELDFYFIHSYRLLPQKVSGEKAICEYGDEFVAAYQNGNIYGTQFHPEKSQTNGLRLLNNFLNL
jgi:glutamine amidotransferase